jgi:hypothetical protein
MNNYTIETAGLLFGWVVVIASFLFVVFRRGGKEDGGDE